MVKQSTKRDINIFFIGIVGHFYFSSLLHVMIQMSDFPHKSMDLFFIIYN